MAGRMRINKKAVAALFCVAALGTGVVKTWDWATSEGEIAAGQAGATAAEEAPDLKPQKTAAFYKPSNGRRYILWSGTVIEELINSTGFDVSEHNLGKNIYDFDLRVIFHISDANGSEPPQRTLFSETADENGRISPHIEHVRQVACELADTYAERADSGTYEAVPEDIAVFRERHCPVPVPASTPAP